MFNPKFSLIVTKKRTATSSPALESLLVLRYHEIVISSRKEKR